MNHRSIPYLALALVTSLVIFGGAACGGGGGGTTTATDGSTGPTTTTTSGISTGMTDGGVGGVLAANKIFYWTGSNSIRSISPDGSNDTAVTSVSSNIISATINPVVANEYIFAYKPDAVSPIGIYRNSSLALAGATAIVSPLYDDVVSLQVSPDGKTLYFVGLPISTTVGNLYSVPMAGGTPTALDKAESAHLNTKGDYLVYSQYIDSLGRAQIFVRSSALTGTPIQLPSASSPLAFDTYLPQWSKKGDRLVFTGIPLGTAQREVFVMDTKGKNLVQLTTTPTIDERSATFGPDDTTVAYTAINTDATKSGLYTASSTVAATGTTSVKLLTNLGDQIYWTGSNGRGIHGSFGMPRSLKRVAKQ